MTNEITAVSTAEVAQFDAKPLMMAAFDLSTIESKKRMFAVENNSVSLSEHLEETPEQTLHVEGLTMKPTTTVDQETGEVKSTILTTFITPDGSFATISKGVAKCAKGLFDVFYDEDTRSFDFPEEGIDIEFKKVKLKAGRSMTIFEWI